MERVHEKASVGYSAGSATYVKGRPDYPPALDGWLRSVLGLGAGRRVLDLGAGTGKFTPRLTATGAGVAAVEPVAEMRAELSSRNPTVDAHAGAADAIPFADASFDAVVCAQSFHWFATTDALAEIRRVLAPGGMLGLVWNVRDESVAWVAELTRILAPYEGGVPRYASMAWRKLFPAAGFGPISETKFAHGHTGDAEDVIVNRMMSVSFIAALPTAEQRRVAAEIRALIARTSALAMRPTVTFPYTTSAFACRRVD